MANKFWVGGTGSWSDTTHWATSTGGAGNTGIPATGDFVTFDAASGGGTVTCDVVSGLSLNTLTAGAFTGTLDFTGGNPNLTFTRSDGSAAVNLSGTGARKYLLGSGTWTLTHTAGPLFELGTTTNLDPTSVTTVNVTYTATTSSERQFSGGGRTFGALTISTNTSHGGFRIFGNNTFSSISLPAGIALQLPSGTTTITSAGVLGTGSSSEPILIAPTTVSTGTSTLSFSGAVTADWVSLVGITTAGVGSFVGTNGLNFGRVTFDSGDSLAVPSGSGGGGQRVISG